MFYHPKHADSLSVKLKDEVKKDWDRVMTKYNIKQDTNILTSYYSIPRRLIRYTAKNLFPNFNNKRENKLKLFNQELLDPESKLWDSKFS